MRDHLDIRTLGGLSILRNGTLISNFDQRKVPALLVYLASTGRKHSREVLAEMFWEARPQGNALRRLSVAITNLRQTVEPFVDIQRGSGTVSMGPADTWILDTAEFEARLDVAGHTDASMLEHALTLYQGDFLEGFYVNSYGFEEWATRERQRLQIRAIDALDSLVNCFLVQGEYQLGLKWAMHLLEKAPEREKTHCWIMELLAYSGERTRALVQFEELCSILANSDLAPMDETVALARRIEGGDIKPTPRRDPPRQVASDPVLDRSHYVQSAILVRTHNDIPFQAKRLIGRDALIVEIHALLDQTMHVLLQGLGGIGKTVLAAEVLAQRVAQGKGPALWLNVGQGNADTMLEALAWPFKAQQAVAAAPAVVKFQAVRHLLTEHGIRIVVLDDVWDGRVCKVLVDALPVDVSLLVTSRQRYPAAKIVEVDQLALVDAVELLSLHAYQFFAPDEPDAVELCQLFGFHPFAIEIAGKTLQVDMLTPAELLHRIGTAPHTACVPQQYIDEGRESVKDLLDDSIETLGPETREVFFAFGALFTTMATTKLLSLCMERDIAKVENALIILYRRGLTNRIRFSDEVSIYHIHDLAYSYIRENVQFDSQAIVRACQEYTAQHTDALEALDAEIGNLLGAAQRALHIRHNDALVEILRLLAVEAEYFLSRGYDSQALDLLHHAAQTAQHDGQIAVAHHLFTKLGNAFLQYIEQFDRAFEAYSEALALARVLKDAHRESTLLALLGTTRFRLGAGDADMYYEQAYQLAKDHNDERALGTVLNHRSYYEGQKTSPDFERSWQFSNEAVEIARAHAMHEFHFASLMNRGNCERMLGRLDTALSTHERAFEIACQHDNHHWQASALRALGEDYHELGEEERAQRYFDESLALWWKTGSVPRAKSLADYMREHNYCVKSETLALQG